MPTSATVAPLPLFEQIQTTYQERPARYSVFWPVTIGNISYGGIYGQIVNISVSGVLFLSPWPHAAGEKVLLSTDHNFQPRLRLIVEVIREQECLPGWYAYGAKIVEISDTERNRLRYVLQTLQGQQFDQAWSEDLPAEDPCATDTRKRNETRRSRLRIRRSAGLSPQQRKGARYRLSLRKRMGAALAGLLGLLMAAFLTPAYLHRESALQVFPSGENSRSSLLAGSHSLPTSNARPPRVMGLKTPALPESFPERLRG